MKIIFFSLLLFFVSITTPAQSGQLVLEKGVAAHNQIDAIYKTFGEAYATLDADRVTNLYSETAVYLAPKDDLRQGREMIRPTFESFFEWVRKEGRTMTISFRIFQRRAEKNMAYDVGVYTIRQFKDGRQIGDAGEGKFMVVAVRQKDGAWRFQVDGYNELKPPQK